jgi:hypothetical protein
MSCDGRDYLKSEVEIGRRDQSRCRRRGGCGANGVAAFYWKVTCGDEPGREKPEDR